MGKLSCGVVILAMGLMGSVHAADIISSVADNKIVGGGTGSGSANKDDTNDNVRTQNAVNNQLKDGVNTAGKMAEEAQSVAKSAAETATNAAAAAADSAKSAAAAAETVAKVETTVNEVQSTVNEVQSTVDKMSNTIVQASTDAANALKESQSAALSAQQAVTDVKNYQNTINTSIENFQQTVNTNLETMHGEVSDIKGQVGAISETAHTAVDTANKAEAKASNAEKIAIAAETKIDAAVADAKSYTDTKFKQFHDEVENVKKVSAAGTASALAASQIPQVSQGSAFSLGVGMGNYAGQSALAVGMSARMGDYTVTKLAFTTDTMANVGAGVGIAVEW